MIEHKDGCVCKERSAELRGASIERQVFYSRGREDRWTVSDAPGLEGGALKKPRRGRNGTWQGDVVLGAGRNEALRVRLAESHGYGISEGPARRFVVRRYYDTDADLYREFDFTARVIATTHDTVVLLPLVRPEEYRFCLFEGSGEQPPV